MKNARKVAIVCAGVAWLLACAGSKSNVVSHNSYVPTQEAGSAITADRSVESAVQLRINGISPKQREQIRNWGPDNNQDIQVRDSLLIWPSTGQRGDSVSVSPSGVVRIHSFEPIVAIGDIDKFYSTFETIYEAIYDGSGGTWPQGGTRFHTWHRDRLWDTTLVVFTPAQGVIYKRIIAREFDFPYTLAMPDCQVSEGRIRLTARRTWGTVKPSLGFIFGTREIFTKTYLSDNGRVSTDDIAIPIPKTGIMAGEYRLDLRKDRVNLVNPNIPQKQGQEPEPERKMVLEFLLTGPCNKSIIIKDGNGQSRQDKTPCRRLDGLLSAH